MQPLPARVRLLLCGRQRRRNACAHLPSAGWWCSNACLLQPAYLLACRCSSSTHTQVADGIPKKIIYRYYKRYRYCSHKTATRVGGQLDEPEVPLGDRPRGECTLPQPGAADKRDYEGTRAAASSCLSRVGRVSGVVGMLGV